MPNIVESTWQRLTGLEPFPQPAVIALRYPVVFMHGFGMLASIRRGGHLHDQAINLRLRGIQAYAPNVPPYTPVPVRAALWKQRLEYIMSETGATKLNLIAHSMGGLDARFLISELGMHEVVNALFTIASPHHGTSLCDIVTEQLERAQEWAAHIFNWMGRVAMQEVDADVMKAVVELTPKYITEVFNPSVPDHPSVSYYSYSARAGKGTDNAINPLLRIQNSMLYAREGLNDGLVSVESAQWGNHLGTIEADHMQQVGLNPIAKSKFDADVFYLSIIDLCKKEGY